MYLFGNLHIFKVHLSVQLDLCADVFLKNHYIMEYLYRLIVLKNVCMESNSHT